MNAEAKRGRALNLQAVKRYQSANRARALASGAAYREKNRATLKTKAAAYRARNRERIRAADAVRYAEDPEKFKSRRAEYRAKNQGKAREAVSRWAARNKVALRIIRQNRKAKIRGRLSRGIADKLLRLQKGLCPACRFQLGDDYQLDHIMPLALGGANEDSNIQLLHARCNQQKKAKHPVTFMREKGYLL